MRTLLIDNYDSYTYNLYQMISVLTGSVPTVRKNDEISAQDISGLQVDQVVISPGPGTPTDLHWFGGCLEIILTTDLPVLGICLGHQGIGAAYGAKVVPATTPVHGGMSPIFHGGDRMFQGIPQGFQAVRYHSLILEDPLPAELVKTAWTADGLIMAMRHRHRPLWGVQFHPESISTEYGESLLRNFMAIHQRAERKTHVNVPVFPTDAASRQSRPVTQPLRIRYRKLPWVNPETVFHRLYGTSKHCFWLDSNANGCYASEFSYMGSANRIVRFCAQSNELLLLEDDKCVGCGTSIFQYLGEYLNLHRQTADTRLPFPFQGGFVGYLSYERDAQWMYVDRFLAFNHHDETLYLVAVDEPGSDASAAQCWFDAVESALETCSPYVYEEHDTHDPHYPHDTLRPTVTWRRTRGEYIADIEMAQKYLRAGESYEICLTNEATTEACFHPLEVYASLRRVNPAPYSAYVRFDDVHVLSSSPERFLKIHADGGVETKPIKGTVRRGQTAEEDARLRKWLREDEKNRSENLMIVDLLRNDLGTVCVPGSVHVPKLMEVESYQTVHQLVSTVCGQLLPDKNAMDCIWATFPGGSMTGAPKKRTLEIISEIERRKRGIYSGTVGWIGLTGAADLNIVIRTIVMTNREVSWGAGGAITILSNPDEEYEEIMLKSDALIDALAKTRRTMNLTPNP